MATAMAMAGFFIWIMVAFMNGGGLGHQAIDGKTAARAMEYRKVGIPDGFTFTDGAAYHVFSGADSYRVHYRAPDDFTAAKSAVAKANPHFPALRDRPCADPDLARIVESMKLSCTPTLRLAIATAYTGDLQHPPGDVGPGASDVTSLLVADTGGGVELLVSSAGH